MEEDFKILEKFLKGIQFNELEELMKSDEVIKFIDYKELKAIENLLTRYKELQIRNDELNKAIGKEYELGRAQGEYEVNEGWKYKIKEKIDEQLKEASDVLDNENYLDNFNGNKDEQEYYYEGYRDATLFLQELLEEE